MIAFIAVLIIIVIVISNISSVDPEVWAFCGFLLCIPIVMYIISKKREKKKETEKVAYEDNKRLAEEKRKEALDQKIKKNHVNITPDLFTFEEAKQVMIGSDHNSCKSVYDYKRFFQSAFDCLLINIHAVEIEMTEPKDIRRDSSTIPIERYKNLTKSTILNSYRNFIAIDTETTGLNPDSDDIIELTAIKFISFEPEEIFHTYLKPRKHIPKKASDINHITDDMVANAPEFSQIADHLQRFIEGYHLVAYNAKFDMKFLYASGLDLSKHKSKVYDALSIAKKTIKDNDNDPWVYPSNFKLATICKTRNIGSDSFHSSNADALACAILFIDLIKRLNEVENAYHLVDPTQKPDNIEPFYLKSYNGERL